MVLHCVAGVVSGIGANVEGVPLGAGHLAITGEIQAADGGRGRS